MALRNEPVDYIDTIILGNYICYYLKSGIGIISKEILSYIAKEYNMKGYAVELYHQLLNPDRLRMLEEGVKRIIMAKLLHDDMEKSYVACMYFGAVTELRNKIVERIKGILKNI